MLSSFALVGRTLAAVTSLTGTITSAEPVTLSGNATAIVTLVDQTASPEAGGIIGEQRIDGLAALPVAFDVPYDDARIDPKHAYAVLASVIDGDQEWHNTEPVPAITGGPTVNLEVPVTLKPKPETAITGDVTVPAGVELSKAAVETAVLIKQETGTLVSVDTDDKVQGDTSISFELGYEADLVDPAATYVVRVAIVDGATTWGTTEPVPAIVGGTPVAQPLEVTVEERAEEIPGVQPRAFGERRAGQRRASERSADADRERGADAEPECRADTYSQPPPRRPPLADPDPDSDARRPTPDAQRPTPTPDADTDARRPTPDARPRRRRPQRRRRRHRRPRPRRVRRRPRYRRRARRRHPVRRRAPHPRRHRARRAARSSAR